MKSGQQEPDGPDRVGDPAAEMDLREVPDGRDPAPEAWSLLVEHGDVSARDLAAVLSADRPDRGTRATAVVDGSAADETRARIDLLVSLGSDLLAGQRPGDAEPLLMRALQIAEGHGLDASRVLRTLGSVNQDIGRFDDAEDYYRRALEAVRQRPVPDAGEITRILHNLAVVCDANGRSEEASSLWTEARSMLAP